MRRTFLGCILLMTALIALPAFAAGPQQLDKTAIGPFDNYCDGYGNPGATGLGYVSVLKVSVGVVEKKDDALLDAIVAYDRAEANDAYIGQINMITASSFNGLAGSIWGYDLAVAEEIAHKKQKPLFTLKQYDGSPLPVFDAAPLPKAGQALFGTEKARRFPPAPGAHVICANKSTVAFRPRSGKPNPKKGQAYGVWSYIAISITKDRTVDAGLFIEDAGGWTKNHNAKDRKNLFGSASQVCGRVHRGQRPRPERGLQAHLHRLCLCDHEAGPDRHRPDRCPLRGAGPKGRAWRRL